MEEWPLTCWQGCFSTGCKYSDAGEESWHNIVGMAAIWPPLCNTMPGNMTEKFVFLVSLFPGFYQIFVIGLRGNSLIVHLLYLWQSVGNTSWPACSLLHYFVGHCKRLAALVTECSCSWLSSLQPFSFRIYFTSPFLCYYTLSNERHGQERGHRSLLPLPRSQPSARGARESLVVASVEGQIVPAPGSLKHICAHGAELFFCFLLFFFTRTHNDIGSFSYPPCNKLNLI